jgi:hypothetical protein
LTGFRKAGAGVQKSVEALGKSDVKAHQDLKRVLEQVAGQPYAQK